MKIGRIIRDNQHFLMVNIFAIDEFLQRADSHKLCVTLALF